MAPMSTLTISWRTGCACTSRTIGVTMHASLLTVLSSYTQLPPLPLTPRTDSQQATGCSYAEGLCCRREGSCFLLVTGEQLQASCIPAWTCEHLEACPTYPAAFQLCIQPHSPFSGQLAQHHQACAHLQTAQTRLNFGLFHSSFSLLAKFKLFCMHLVIWLASYAAGSACADVLPTDVSARFTAELKPFPANLHSPA